MNLLNEAREFSYFKMPGDCNKMFQSLMKQISKYLGVSEKGNPYRVLGLFLIQYLLNRYIITYGENRDLTVHYTKEEAVDAIEADKAFIDKVGLKPRNSEYVNTFQKLAPDIKLPVAEWDFGSSIGGSRPAGTGEAEGKAPRTSTNVNRLVSALISTGRFNCSHVEDFKNYAEAHLRGYATQFQRSREGQEVTDREGFSTGKPVELKNFVYDPNYVTRYVTQKSLQRQQGEIAVDDRDILSSNSDVKYLFFLTYYMPTMLLMYDRSNLGDTSIVSDLLVTTNSIEEFRNKLIEEREKVNLRLEKIPKTKYNEDDVAEIEEELAIFDDFLSNVEEYDEHTREYMFGVSDVAASQQLSDIIDIGSVELGDDIYTSRNTPHNIIKRQSTSSSPSLLDVEGDVWL